LHETNTNGKKGGEAQQENTGRTSILSGMEQRVPPGQQVVPVNEVEGGLQGEGTIRAEGQGMAREETRAFLRPKRTKGGNREARATQRGREGSGGTEIVPNGTVIQTIGGGAIEAAVLGAGSLQGCGVLKQGAAWLHACCNTNIHTV
jgi:hypothetical protein